MDDGFVTHPIAEMFANRLRKNRRKLKSWRARSGVSCYRLYDRDIPEIPLAVDVYDGRLHIAEYARPGGKPGWLDAAVAAAAMTLEVPPSSVFVKRRERQRGARQYDRVAVKGRRFEVTEGGHRFWVNLSDYLDTGLFLDHRETRARFASEAAGKRVLNLFCYTGAFTVYAAGAGAGATTSVDMSRTYLDWARDNMTLNGFDPGIKHRFLREDLVQMMDDPGDTRRGYDLIVVDPPTFSNSKKMRRPFDIQRDHGRLLRFARSRARDGAVIYFSTNFRRFKLDGAATDGMDVVDITEDTMPTDFRNQRIHRCFRMAVRS